MTRGHSELGIPFQEINSVKFCSNKFGNVHVVPLKIKIFMWYLIRGVVLTKDNLLRRNWHGDRKNDLVFDKKPMLTYLQFAIQSFDFSGWKTRETITFVAHLYMLTTRDMILT
ncbi:hypothetical protein ACJX0J_034762 [Zea mays]